MRTAAHIRPMTEIPAAKAAFAPAWPYLYKAPDTEFFGPYGHVSAFNRNLTADELKPLTDDCPAPGWILRKIAYWGVSGTSALTLALWLWIWATARLHGVRFDLMRGPATVTPETADLRSLITVVTVVWIAAAAAWVAGLVVDFIAWKKWGASVTAAWTRYKGRIVVTRDLPEERRKQVNLLGTRLDDALEKLDANDPGARPLSDAARGAISRLIDLPVIGEDARRVARSAVADASVQKIREEFEAATAKESALLQDAEDAVQTVQDYADKVRAAAAAQEIIELAKTITARTGQ
jgi:hypothetical protein